MGHLRSPQNPVQHIKNNNKKTPTFIKSLTYLKPYMWLSSDNLAVEVEIKNCPVVYYQLFCGVPPTVTSSWLIFAAFCVWYLLLSLLIWHLPSISLTSQSLSLPSLVSSLWTSFTPHFLSKGLLWFVRFSYGASRILNEHFES